MRFMVMVKATEDSENGVMPTCFPSIDTAAPGGVLLTSNVTLTGSTG